MPRYVFITCPNCKQTVKRPLSSDKPQTYCSRKCEWEGFKHQVSERIRESVEIAITRLYVDEHASFREIARTLKINERTVHKLLDELVIPIRYGSEAVKTQWENNPERRKTTGGIFSITAQQRTGEKHPNYRGGAVDYGLSASAMERLRDAVRSRDHFQCTCCGISNTDYKQQHNRQLDIHHIIPYRYSHDNSLNNLRTVCLACHRQLEKEFMYLF